MDIENISAWSTRLKIIFIGTVCLLIIILWTLLITRSQWDQLMRAQQMENQLQQQIMLKKPQPFIQKKLGILLQQLPKKTEIHGLLEDISKIGIASGLEFKLFKPLSEKKQEFYTELPFQISVIGTYHQFTRFINKISILPQIVTLHDFTIEPIAESQTLMMSIIAKTYRYTGNISVDNIKKIIPQQKLITETKHLRSPFDPVLQETQHQKNPLQAFPLSALKMTGILKETNKKWALITAPNGMVYKVTVGDYMGQQAGRITTIDDDGVELPEGKLLL
jgi:type IV pilus assembly protein PilO